MTSFPFPLAMSVVAIVTWASGFALAQNAPPPVPMRGPVHEAFAPPAEVRAVGPLVPREPPNLIREVPSAERPAGRDAVWVPGYWAWDDEAKDFHWVSGGWQVPPAGKTWTAGKWVRAGSGWRWVSGYWAGPGADAPQMVLAAPPALRGASPVPNGDTTDTAGQWIFEKDEWVWHPGGEMPPPKKLASTLPQYRPTQGGSPPVPRYRENSSEVRSLPPVTPASGLVLPFNRPIPAYQPGVTAEISGRIGSLYFRSGPDGFYAQDFGAPNSLAVPQAGNPPARPLLRAAAGAAFNYGLTGQVPPILGGPGFAPAPGFFPPGRGVIGRWR